MTSIQAVNTSTTQTKLQENHLISTSIQICNSVEQTWTLACTGFGAIGLARALFRWAWSRS